MNDASLRFSITLALLSLFVLLEYLRPARPSVLGLARITNQIGLALISAIAARLALGGGLAGVSIFAHDHGWGLFNMLEVPMWAVIGLSFLALDFAVWAQHLVLHHVPFLWRLHRVHHGDTAMDVTTALRFHPVEILASLGYKAAIVVLLGAPAAAVFVFEIVLGAGALFTHANIKLPRWLEQPLRLIVVTPALHLIHHSPNPIETNSNFGFSFSFWDRLFGTFREVPLDANGLIGLQDRRAPADQTLAAMLVNPLK
jgi:sterol desaturase/sphingolipid hydroxylase (fatty acid hydroxylase superfamily)